MYPLHRLFLSLNRTLEDSSIQPKGCEKTTCWPSSLRGSDVKNKYFVSTSEFIKIIKSDNGAQKVTINLGPDGIKWSLWCILIWMILDHKFPICNGTIPVPAFHKHAKKTYVYSFLDFTNSCFHTAAKLVDQSLYIQTQNQHTDMNKLNKTEYNIVCLLTCIDSVGFVMYLRTP